MELVNDFLERSASQTPDKLALVCGETRLSYGQIDTMARRLANALRQNGVSRGDRVVIFLPNGVGTVVGLFATLKASGVFVVINETTKPSKLIRILNNCRPTAILLTARQADLAAELLVCVPSLKCAVLTEGDIPDRASSQSGILSYASVQEEYPDGDLPRESID